MDHSRGAELAKLLLSGFNILVDEVIVELERQGHPGVTATHEFALQAIDKGAQSASELGRSLNVSKQAAAKSIAALEDLGYLQRHSDPVDARRKTLIVTARGYEMMSVGAEAFDQLRNRLAEQVGAARLESLEEVLRSLAAPSDQESTSRPRAIAGLAPSDRTPATDRVSR
ncbi:MarR family winged helix-turn-helix transcriptional regulator [Sanguibacter gelidistatuariae]|uniref:MarR family winged helix-turn-helix transcriptional regulator n=1 Tax=Sanguibacter gelidistatuariae TaxID=1814289 RepID=UPI000B829B89|nr:MarR family transcriptional regulator [Sanguibacter gelidistatuariae]